MILKNKLFFVFCLVLSTISAEKITVMTNSTKENHKTARQTIVYEKIQTEDPSVSAKFQTGNARFGVWWQTTNDIWSEEF